jgi:hypothetical protein
VDDEKAERLDIGQIWMIQVLGDQADGFGGIRLGGGSGVSIPSDEAGRAPVRSALVDASRRRRGGCETYRAAQVNRP